MITIEMVEKLREKMDVDYRLAEKALRKGKGSVDGAIIWLKKREERWIRRFVRWCIKAVKYCCRYLLIIEKEDHIYLNLPLFVAVGFVILFDISTYQWPFILIILFLLVVISKSTIKIKLKESVDVTPKKKIKLTIDPEPKATVIHTENDIPIVMKEEVTEEVQEKMINDANVKVIEDEDGFNEVTISE